MFYTFQDFEKRNDKDSFISAAINKHLSSEEVKMAKDADLYAAQLNSTINNFVPVYYTALGIQKIDHTKSNNHIACNFFDYLNSQRTNYSLGNGITFTDDKTIDKLGKDFSTVLSQAAYYALIHGRSFIFWTGEQTYNFKITEFVPLIDEETSALRAGIRFWQIDEHKPMFAVLYEEDGYTKYKSEGGVGDFKVIQEKKSYRQTIKKAPADEVPEVIGEDNYSRLPIFTFYGSKTQISTLYGMKGAIDAYDMGISGFANSMDQCSDLLTIISNAEGMDEIDMIRVRDWMKMQGMIVADEGQIHTVDRKVDYAARQSFLSELRRQIFEDFGGLDVHTIMSGATNDHISAAYEPLNAKADDFEDQITKGLRPFLEMLDIDDSPSYKRKAIANDAQYNNSILAASQYLDRRTILEKLTFVENDEVQIIIDRKDEEEMQAVEMQQSLMMPPQIGADDQEEEPIDGESTEEEESEEDEDLEEENEV